MNFTIADFYASVAYSAVKGGVSRFSSFLSEHEIEKAARQTAEEYENISAGMLTEALLAEDIGSVTEGIPSDVIVNQLITLAENSAEVQLNEDPEDIVEEFLHNIEREVSRKDENVHRVLQTEFRKQQTTNISEVLEQVEKILGILETVGSAGYLEGRSPKIKISETPEIEREAYHTVSYTVQHAGNKWEEQERVPVTQAVTVENTGDGVVENCRIWLDFIQISVNRDSYANVLKPGLKYPINPGAQAEIFHLHTQLPWKHPTTDGTVTIGPHESVEVEFLGETQGAYSFIFPSSEGFPEATFANLYVGRNPDATYPTDWWWLAERESELVFAELSPKEEYVCLLRVTGSNVEPHYVLADFNWEGWYEESSAPLPISLKEIQTVETDLSVPLDVEALRDTYGGIPKTIAQPTDSPAERTSPITVIGDPDEPLPPETSFSKVIPNPDTAATASLALEDFDEFAFNYYEYVLAATARRIANPEDREYYSLPEVANRLLEAEEDSSERILRSYMLSIEEIRSLVSGTPEIRISDAAAEDLKSCSVRTRGQHVSRIANLGELEEIPGAPLQQLASTSLDRPLYEYDDTGIVLWIAPNRATPAVPNSVDGITVEAAVDAEEWDNHEYMMSLNDREDVEEQLGNVSNSDHLNEE